MKKILVLLVFTIASFSIHADCPTSDIILTSQADIDAFPSNYTGCTNMLHRVTIKESVAGDIVNLNGLSQLTSIGGDFFILSNSALTDLTGVGSLSMIAGYFSIEGNNGLTSLTGLTALASVGSLTMDGNLALTSLNGLGALTSIPVFFVFRNTALTSFTGLGAVTSLGCLIIDSNTALSDFTGLGTVNYINCYVTIHNNSVLTSLSGLDAVTIFNDDLLISNNPSLTNLTGLGSCTMIRGNLSMSNNATLANLFGLGPLISIGSSFARNLSIKNNAALTSLIGLGTVTSIGGFIDIGSNAALSDITDLSSVTSIGTYLNFENNTTLTSLSGLGNIDTSTITNLTIINSTMLSVCEVPSICAYLANPSNSATISGNATGCATRIEVETACAALPIDLVYFQVEIVDDKPSLSWQTASETNNDYFQVEHSMDGHEFIEIGRVEGNRTTMKLNNYIFSHQTPIVGTNYYRLMQMDFDGAFEYSKVISIDYQNSDNKVLVFPNPSNGLVNIHIENPSNQRMIVKVADNFGRGVWESEFTEDASTWSKLVEIEEKGLFYIIVQIGSDIFYERVIITD